VTETEWLAASDPGPLLEFLRGRGSDRKLRLFACACCRRIRPKRFGPHLRDLVEACEGLADGAVPRARLDTYYRAAMSRAKLERPAMMAAAMAPLWAAAHDAVTAAVEACAAVAEYRGGNAAPGEALRHAEDPGRGGQPDEAVEQAALLREIFGNPFRVPPAVNAAGLAWNGGTVRRLARSSYERRLLPSGRLDPERLAVLADALEEAGRTDAAILGHLRGPGPHVRGCWAVDLLLGKG
jgi:hypothetical protein